MTSTTLSPRESQSLNTILTQTEVPWENNTWPHLSSCCWCEWLCQRSNRWQLSFGKISPPRIKALMGESWIGMAPRALTTECLLVLLCFYTFVAAIFLWSLAQCEWVCEDPHCLECSVIISWKYLILLGIFTYELLWKWFPFKLYWLAEAMIL